MERTNNRGFKETYFENEHLTLKELSSYLSLKNRYLQKRNVPLLPQRVEFHVSNVIHVTSQSGLNGIVEHTGFKLRMEDEQSGRRGGRFLWWDLHVSDVDIKEAELRFLQAVLPCLSQEKVRSHQRFLKRFTTSPAFQEKSLYGNFKFTFPLQELLEAYKWQICKGQSPVLRVHETVVYRREIQYRVVVHSPKVQDFDNCPLLQSSEDAPCSFVNGTIVWRAQAISNTYKLRCEVKENSVHVGSCSEEEYYMWEHISLAFHLPPDATLCFDQDRLLGNLSPCELLFNNICPEPEHLTIEMASDIIKNLQQKNQKERQY